MHKTNHKRQSKGYKKEKTYHRYKGINSMQDEEIRHNKTNVIECDQVIKKD